MGKKKNIYKVIAIVCGVICLIAVIWLIRNMISLEKAKKQMDYIVDNYISDNSGQKKTEAKTETQDTQETVDVEVSLWDSLNLNTLDNYNVPEKNIDFSALAAEQNEDIYAWITVPGTKIDYPIVQNPEELDYYLEHNLDGSKGLPGCIYTQFLNSKDWTDNNTVVYGHNMKNGTMFKGLHNYEDPNFFEDNPYIYVYTEDGYVLVYKIFAAYKFPAAHLLLCFDMSTPEGYQEYLDSIFTYESFSSNFNMGITLNANNKIITLSTCISNEPDLRYQVQGVLVARGEK